MKYLFVHQNFPGQFLHVVRHLARSPDNEIVFISESNQNAMKGVRRVIYRMPHTNNVATHPAAREFESGMLRAEVVAKTATTLKALGYIPDIIIGHHGWGELLNLVDVFPDTPILGYFEFFYQTSGLDVGFDPEFEDNPDLYARVRAKNAINLQALALNQFGQTPTLFQRSTYPEWAQSSIALLEEGADLDLCLPNPAIKKRDYKIKNIQVKKSEKLITYVSRDLEPYRGFHQIMRALPKVLSERSDTRIVLVGGDGVSYGAKLEEGNWRERMLAEVGGDLDLSRVHFVGKVDYDDFRSLLQRSDAHVYLTYPFVASWSLRESMSSGCPIVGSATAPVEEFVSDRKTGLLVPFHKPSAIADGILELLEDTKLAQKLGKAARKQAEKTLNMDEYLVRYEKLIDSVVNN